MWNQLFWFSQPSIVLSSYDNYFLWIFAILTGFGMFLKLAVRFSRHAVFRKLINKFGSAALWMGLIGLLWFALRYENTPIFAYRLWAGLIILIFAVWTLFVLKYAVLKFPTEKRDFDKILLNSKYIPGSKK